MLSCFKNISSFRTSVEFFISVFIFKSIGLIINMVMCAAFGCGNNSSRCKLSQESGLSYFRFPKDPKMRNMWIKATRLQNWTPSKHSVLCSKHFEDRYIDRSSLYSVRLEKNAIPTIFPGFPAHLQKKIPSRKPPKPRILPAIENTSAVESLVPVVECSVPPVDKIGVSSFINPPVQHVSNLPRHTSKENVTTPVDPLLLDTPREVMLKKTISNIKSYYGIKIKHLQQTIRRQAKKISTLEDVIASLHLYPSPVVYDVTQSSESEPQEIESALCSISSEQIKTTASATITRSLKGVCHAREVREQLRHIEMSLMKEIHHVLRQVQLLHKNQQKNRPVVFKYIK